MSFLKKIWTFNNEQNDDLLSERPTAEEREAYITYKIEKVFKNNFSKHAQVKTEVIDHFVEAIESSPTRLSKKEFVLKYEDLYDSFGRGQGIRKMVYDRAKSKQYEESKVAMRFRQVDSNILTPVVIGVSTATLMDTSSGTGRFLVYISLITLSILLLHATYKLTSLSYQRSRNSNDERHKGIIAKNIKWVTISLIVTAFYFPLSDTILTSRFFALVIFGISYFIWRKYTIDHIRHKEWDNKSTLTI